MHHFQLLSLEEQRAAIQRLANSGMSDATIAAATGLSVEQIRSIIVRPVP
jgi:DNA-directed RNA polymerase specialized sigma24 family protein